MSPLRPALLAAALALAGAAPGHAETAKGVPQYDPAVFKSKKEYLCIIKGREFANRGEYEKAVELFQRAVELHPESSAHYWKGLAHERLAYETIKQWNERPQRDAALVLDEAGIKNHYQRALEAYQKAVAFFPDVDYIHYQLGKAEADYFKDWTSAAQHLLKAVELNPGEMVYRVDLAHAYLGLKQFADARKAAETALSDKRTVVQSHAYAALGEIELEQKNVSKAVEELRLALSLNPGTAVCHLLLARAYGLNQQLESASESHRNFLRMFAPGTLEELAWMKDSRQDLARLESAGGKRR